MQKLAQLPRKFIIKYFPPVIKESEYAEPIDLENIDMICMRPYSVEI